MKRLILSFLFFLIYLSAWSQQDTVVIKNIKQYKEGKVNILKTPSGKKTIVTLSKTESDWKEHDDTDTSLYWDRQKRKLKQGIDTISLSPSPLPLMALLSSVIYNKPILLKSYVDPGLTTIQKANIKANECINAKFAGLSRSKVKTSIVSGNMHTYNTLLQFLNTLPPDVDMEVVVDELSRPWKDRAIQEQKNVTLKNVFLKAYNREGDNDYHLIICNADQTIFFNAEISGLPGNSAASFQTIKNVRNIFETFPGEKSCGGSYVKFTDPIKIVKLKGSIFFDTDHAAGTVGPLGFRPETAWEIHPVTLIQFE
jgi:hypothetical protein